MTRATKKIRRLPFEKQAEQALRAAVRGVIEENLRLGLPVYVGRGGKVVALSPSEALRLSRRRPKKNR